MTTITSGEDYSTLKAGNEEEEEIENDGAIIVEGSRSTDSENVVIDLSKDEEDGTAVASLESENATIKKEHGDCDNEHETKTATVASKKKKRKRAASPANQRRNSSPYLKRLQTTFREDFVRPDFSAASVDDGPLGGGRRKGSIRVRALQTQKKIRDLEEEVKMSNRTISNMFRKVEYLDRQRTELKDLVQRLRREQRSGSGRAAAVVVVKNETRLKAAADLEARVSKVRDEESKKMRVLKEACDRRVQTLIAEANRWKVEARQTKTNAAATDNSGLAETVASLESENATIKKERDDCNAENANLQAQLEAVSKKAMITLERTVAKNKSAHEKMLKGLEKRLAKQSKDAARTLENTVAKIKAANEKERNALEARLAAQSEDATRTLESTAAKIKSAKNAVAKVEMTNKKERNALEARLAAQSKEATRTLESTVAKIKSANEKELKGLKAQLAEAQRSQRTVADLRQEIARERVAHETELNRLRRSYQAEKAENGATSKNAAAVVAARDELDATKKIVQRLHRQVETLRETLKEEEADRANAIEKIHEESREALKQAHEKSEKEREAFNDKLDELRNAFAEEREYGANAAKAAKRRAADRIKEETDKRNAALAKTEAAEATLLELRSKFEAKERQLATETGKLRDAVTSGNASLRDAERARDLARQELAEARKERGSAASSEELASLKEKLAATEAAKALAISKADKLRTLALKWKKKHDTLAEASGNARAS